MADLKPVVLVVDDEPMVRRLVASVVAELEPERVIEAEDGLQAQAVLREESVDLVITDVNMPRLDGLALLKWAHEQDLQTKWIVLSSIETFDAAVDALKSGAFDYLAKPPERHRLLVAVRNAFDQIQLEADRTRLYAELEDKNVALAAQLEQLAGMCQMLEDQAEVIESDLERAAVIQRALLPQAPPELDGWSLQTLYRPGTKVGGDFYEVVHLGVRYFGVIIADASGQGVAAAMLAVLFKQVLGFRDTDGVRAPGRVLASANKQMCAEVNAPGAFVTAAYVLVDRRDHKLHIASAGHTPCIHLAADGTTQQLLRTGPALGLSTDARYDETTVDFAPGDRLLLYTDGVLNDDTSNTLVAQIPATTDRQQLLRDLYGWAAGRSGYDNDDTTLVLIDHSDAPSHFDNGAVESRDHAQPNTESNAHLTSGVSENHAFMQISSRATWMRGAIFYAAAEALLQEHAHLTIDLRHCEYLDSTFLGTIYEIVTVHPNRVDLQRVPDKIIDLFDELSMQPVIDCTNVKELPLPNGMEPLKRVIKEDEQKERLLKAHEVLVTLSDENEEQFRSVVATLRAELGEGSA